MKGTIPFASQNIPKPQPPFLTMYPTVPNEFHKSPTPSAPPTPPPPYHEPPATGIPVVQPPSNYSYGGDYSQNPTPPHHQHQIRPNEIPSGLPRNWSSGLCHCCSDCSSCCTTCWCPCVTFGQVSEILDKGSTSCIVNATLYGLICYLTGCACIYSFFYRTKMRKQYGLPEKPCADFLVHFCCECCALCQEYRHLKSLGFDLSIGWRGNMEQINQGVIRPPVVPHGMSR